MAVRAADIYILGKLRFSVAVNMVVIELLKGTFPFYWFSSLML